MSQDEKIVQALEEKTTMERQQEVSLDDLDKGLTLNDDPKRKHFSSFALIGLSFAILNTWAASSGSIYIGMSSGGPTSIIYGTIAGTLGALAIATSLAEMCHVIPSKGAQYHWCYAFAFDSRWQRPLSYFSGFMGTAAWIALTSTAPYLTAQSIIVQIQVFHPDFTIGPWFTFVVYMALTAYGALVNIFGIKAMNAMNTASLVVSPPSFHTLLRLLSRPSSVPCGDADDFFCSLCMDSTPSSLPWPSLSLSWLARAPTAASKAASSSSPSSSMSLDGQTASLG
jgi:hypothetical protein